MQSIEELPIQIERILGCLAQLANKKFQQRAWYAKVPGVTTSPIETYEQLFGDSNLEKALQQNSSLFSKATDNALQELQTKLLPLIKDGVEAADIRFDEIRNLAGNLLSEIILEQGIEPYREYLNTLE